MKHVSILDIYDITADIAIDIYCMHPEVNLSIDVTEHQTWHETSQFVGTMLALDLLEA